MSTIGVGVIGSGAELMWSVTTRSIMNWANTVVPQRAVRLRPPRDIVILCRREGRRTERGRNGIVTVPSAA